MQCAVVKKIESSTRDNLMKFFTKTIFKNQSISILQVTSQIYPSQSSVLFESISRELKRSQLYSFKVVDQYSFQF